MSILLFQVLSCHWDSGWPDRIGANYFPLSVGNEWVFVSSIGDTVSAKVLTDTLIEGDSAVIWEFQGRLAILQPTREGILRRYRSVGFYQGDEVVLEDRWGPWMELPPVDGNTWQDSFANQVVMGSETLSVVRTLRGSVTYVGDLQVLGQTYQEVYQMKILTRQTLIPRIPETLVDTSWWYLAPDLGPVLWIRVYTVSTAFFRDTFRLLHATVQP